MFFIRFTQAIGKYPSIIITYFITLIGWVLFRAESLGFAFDYIGRMFAFDGIANDIWLDAEFKTMIEQFLVLLQPLAGLNNNG